MFSTRVWVSRIPALLTSAVTGPKVSGTASNIHTTSDSLLTLPGTAMAFPPEDVICTTTVSAAEARE